MGLLGREAAISKNHILKNWGYGLTFVDYIHDRNLSSRDVVVMKKGTLIEWLLTCTWF